MLNRDMRAMVESQPISVRKFVYVASPYSHGDEATMQERLKDADVACAALRQHSHLDPYSPVVETVRLKESGFEPQEGWYCYDLTRLKKADYLLVLKLDGWELSVGVFAEICCALALDISIFYCTLDEVRAGNGIPF